MPGSTMPYDTEIERVEAQNPLMTFEWLPWLSPNARFHVGVSLAIPSAAIQRFGDANQAGPANPEEAAIFDATRSTHMVWMAMNGAWSPYRYEAERVAVAVPVGVALDLGSVELAFDGALAVSVPVLGGTGVTDATAQIAAEIHGTPVTFDRGSMSLGLRAQLVGYHLGATGALFPEVAESAQPGFEPWMRIDVAPAFLTLRGVLNLGGTYGLGTETGVWAIHLGGGAAIE